MKSRLILIFLFVFLLAFAISNVKAGAEDTPISQSKQQKLEEINKKLAESKKKLLETKKKEAMALSQLVLTKTKLKQTERNLNRANQKISLNQAQIGKLSTDLKETYDILQVKSVALKKRLIEVYKNSSVNYLELLLSAT